MKQCTACATSDGRLVEGQSAATGLASEPAPGEFGFLASTSVSAHLLRGAIGVALLMWALGHQLSDPMVAIGAGIAAVVALRGCPTCWMIGLFATIRGRR